MPEITRHRAGQYQGASDNPHLPLETDSSNRSFFDREPSFYPTLGATLDQHTTVNPRVPDWQIT